MTTPGFKSFVNATKKKTRTLGAVERYLLAKPRDTSRSTTVLHPSDMVNDKWCYRASYFMLLGNEPAPEPASRRGLRTQLVFAEGHAIHSLWQNWFGKMGNLYGTWFCKTCQNKFWDRSPEHCYMCGAKDIKYREVPVYNEQLRIAGHSDGWLMGLGDDLLLEIKSIGEGTIRFDSPQLLKDHGSFESAWKAITEPFSKHAQQVQLYMALLQDAYDAGVHDMPEPPKEALMLYQSKATQDVKEFVIPANRRSVQHLLGAAQLIVDCIEQEIVPECNVGGEFLCSRCEVYR